MPAAAVVAGLGARRRRAARLRRPPATPAREGPEPAALRRVPAPTVGRRLVDGQRLARRAARPRRRHQGGVAVRAHELAVEGHGREPLVPHELERAERERREVAPEAEGVRRRAGPARRRLAERLLEAAPGVARGEGRLARLGCPCNWWRQERRVAEGRVVGAGEAERIILFFLLPVRGPLRFGFRRGGFDPCRFFVLGLCAGADGEAERDEYAEPRHRAISIGSSGCPRHLLVLGLCYCLGCQENASSDAPPACMQRCPAAVTCKVKILESMLVPYSR